LPKTKKAMMKHLEDYRKELGLVLCKLWVKPAKREQLKKDYPPPTLKDLQPAKDYYEEIK